MTSSSSSGPICHFPCIFPCYFGNSALETGSNSTASSARQSSLSGVISGRMRTVSCGLGRFVESPTGISQTPCAWIWCIGGASLRSSFFNFRFEVPQTGSINDRYRFANRVRSAAVRSTLTEEPHIGLCLTYIDEQGIKIAADCELGLNVTNETLGHEGVQSLL